MVVSDFTTTSIIVSSNKIQNGDTLVPANPGPPGKWALKRIGKMLEVVVVTTQSDHHYCHQYFYRPLGDTHASKRFLFLVI